MSQDRKAGLINQSPPTAALLEDVSLLSCLVSVNSRVFLEMNRSTGRCSSSQGCDCTRCSSSAGAPQSLLLQEISPSLCLTLYCPPSLLENQPLITSMGMSSLPPESCLPQSFSSWKNLTCFILKFKQNTTHAIYSYFKQCLDKS